MIDIKDNLESHQESIQECLEYLTEEEAKAWLDSLLDSSYKNELIDFFGESLLLERIVSKYIENPDEDIENTIHELRNELIEYINSSQAQKVKDQVRVFLDLKVADWAHRGKGV